MNSGAPVAWGRGQRPRRWMQWQWPLAMMLLPEAAVGQAPGKACQCDFADNNWIHEITSMLQHVEDLPNVLQNPEASSTKWILSQSCEEDASKFPNNDLAFDLQNQEVKCLPEHTAMSMVCAQQWIVKKSLMGVVKWVTRINELLQLVAGCMDAHSPIPFRANDFQTYLERFAGGVPPPQHPSFVQTLAWPTKASRKTAFETKLPFLDCIPLKDPTCFPKHTSNPFESCSECCNRNRGPTGQVQCWQSGFDFARCCASEFAEASEAASRPNPDAALQKSLEEERLKKEEISKELAQCQTHQEEAKAQKHEAEKATDLAKTQAEAMKAETAKLKETAEAACAVFQGPPAHGSSRHMTSGGCCRSRRSEEETCRSGCKSEGAHRGGEEAARCCFLGRGPEKAAGPAKGGRSKTTARNQEAPRPVQRTGCTDEQKKGQVLQAETVSMASYWLFSDFQAAFDMCIFGCFQHRCLCLVGSVQDAEIQKMQSELKEAPALTRAGHMRAASVRERF